MKVYRNEIDVMRALAVMSVILFHAGFSYCPGEYVGVNIFFVISGCLITSIILAEHEQGTFSLMHFYERRARRIRPALFVVSSVRSAKKIRPSVDLSHSVLVGHLLLDERRLFQQRNGTQSSRAHLESAHRRTLPHSLLAALRRLQPITASTSTDSASVRYDQCD